MADGFLVGKIWWEIFSVIVLGGKLIWFLCLVACDTIGQILQSLFFPLQLFFFQSMSRSRLANYKINPRIYVSRLVACDMYISIFFNNSIRIRLAWRKGKMQDKSKSVYVLEYF